MGGKQGRLKIFAVDQEGNMKVKGGDVFTVSIEGPGRTQREKITDNKDGVLSSCPCRRKHSTEAGDLGGERLHNKAPPSLSPAPWGEAMEAMKAMEAPGLPHQTDAVKLPLSNPPPHLRWATLIRSEL